MRPWHSLSALAHRLLSTPHLRFLLIFVTLYLLLLQHCQHAYSADPTSAFFNPSKGNKLNISVTTPRPTHPFLILSTEHYGGSLSRAHTQRRNPHPQTAPRGSLFDSRVQARRPVPIVQRDGPSRLYSQTLFDEILMDETTETFCPRYGKLKKDLFIARLFLRALSLSRCANIYVFWQVNRG